MSCDCVLTWRVHYDVWCKRRLGF